MSFIIVYSIMVLFFELGNLMCVKFMFFFAENSCASAGGRGDYVCSYYIVFGESDFMSRVEKGF